MNREQKIKRIQEIRERVESILYKGSVKKFRIEVTKNGEYYGTYWNIEDACLATGIASTGHGAKVLSEGLETNEGFKFTKTYRPIK